MKCSQLAQQKQDNIEMTETVDAALAQVRQLQQEQIAKEKKLDKLKNVESTFDNTFNQVCVCVCVCVACACACLDHLPANIQLKRTAEQTENELEVDQSFSLHPKKIHLTNLVHRKLVVYWHRHRQSCAQLDPLLYRPIIMQYVVVGVCLFLFGCLFIVCVYRALPPNLHNK
jgi:hypothetical protein